MKIYILGFQVVPGSLVVLVMAASVLSSSLHGVTEQSSHLTTHQLFHSEDEEKTVGHFQL